MSWRVAASLDQLLDEINASAPGRSKASDGSIGDTSHSSRESDHNPCDCHDAVCARDFTHDPPHGFDSYAFADWLRSRCDSGVETRVKYIISNRRIASPTDDWAWRDYTGSNPHDHHAHVSVDHPPKLFDDETSWAWQAPTPAPIEIGDLMWVARASDGRWFSGNAIEKMYINSPDTLNFLKRAGAKDMGTVSSAILNEFPTRPGT